MASAGIDLLSALVADGDTKQFVFMEDVTPYLRPVEMQLFEFIRGHVHDNGVLPHAGTVEEDTDFTLTKVKEPSSYYLKRVRDRYVKDVLRTAVESANKEFTIKTGDVDKGVSVIMDAVLRLSILENTAQVVDFRDAYDYVWSTFVSATKGVATGGRTLGWPTFDSQVGGVVAADLVSVVGRPAMGKTWFLLWIALHMWRKYDMPVVFFSMEMPKETMLQRMAALWTSVQMTGLQRGALDSNEKARLHKGMLKVKGMKHPFLLVDGNLCSTVADVYTYSQQLSPSAVFIDGAYLLGHPNPRLNRYQRVAENCDLLKKDVAGSLGVPVVASWQFSKEAEKKKGKAGLADIGYTDAIAQLSSVVLGLFEDDNVETLYKRKIEILKGRSGETGQFYVRWDFARMNFNEIVDPTKSMEWFSG